MLGLAVVVAVGAAIVMAFLPKPIPVEVEVVSQGRMEVAVRDDGRTRIRDRYVVSTPITGRLRRIDLEVGDRVVAGETVVARMEPSSPTLLDPRALAQAEARVKSASGRLKKAQTEYDRATVELEQATVEFERQKELDQRGATSASEFDLARLNMRTRSEDVKAAEFAKEIAEYELELEQAGLLHVTQEQKGDAASPEANANQEFEIYSPITGRVLRVMQESSSVVSPGAPLLEIGDPYDLEVVVDILSSDAIRVKPDQPARFEQWGGNEPLLGVVRLVEPSGFTKISALGVEEQRVNVVLDFISSLGDRMALGDGYRVEAEIIVWENDETITVPTGALFRDGEHWSVFVVKNQKAMLQHVTVGENNGIRVQILSGLSPGELIVLHPDDQLTNDMEVLYSNPIKQSE